MVNRVVATKLTEEEHTKLIDLCNGKGCTPSAFLKEIISEKISPIQKQEVAQKPKGLSLDEIRNIVREAINENKPKFVGIKRI